MHVHVGMSDEEGYLIEPSTGQQSWYITPENACEENGDEQFIQIHNDLSEKDFITTLLHELVHVMQNENGITDDKIREEEAYLFEDILYNQYLQSV